MMSLILLQAQQPQYIHGTWGWILGIAAFAFAGVGVYWLIRFIKDAKAGKV